MINREQWYSTVELAKLGKENWLPFRSQETWLSLIKSGKLKAITKGTEERKSYAVQGGDVLDFLANEKKIHEAKSN